MTRPATQDRHKAKVVKCEPMNLVTVTTHGPVVVLSCGWSARHNRAKIRDDKAEAHVAEHHVGAIWT